MVAELPRTVENDAGLPGRRARSAIGRLRWPRVNGLLLTLAVLGIVVAVSLGLAAANTPSEDVRRLTTPAAAVVEV